MFLKFKSLAAAAIVAVAGLLASSSAHADYFTALATFDVNATNRVTSPPLPNIKQIDQTGGTLFTNTYDNAAGLVRTVGILEITNMLDPASAHAIFGPGAKTPSLVIAFALEGHLINPVTQTALFTAGGFGVFQEGAAFDPDHPATWFSDFTKLVYAGGLASPTGVSPGSGANVTALASDVNVSSVNTANFTLTQGLFLFGTKTDPGSLESSDGTQSKFMNINGLPNSQTGVLSQVSQQVHTTPLALAGADLTTMNTVSSFFLGNTFTTGPDGTYTANLANGDFSATISAKSFPLAVPEPGSLTLLATGSVLALLFARRRKNAKQA